MAERCINIDNTNKIQDTTVAMLPVSSDSTVNVTTENMENPLNNVTAGAKSSMEDSTGDLPPPWYKKAAKDDLIWWKWLEQPKLQNPIEVCILGNISTMLI